MASVLGVDQRDIARISAVKHAGASKSSITMRWECSRSEQPLRTGTIIIVTDHAAVVVIAVCIV